jgi:hypothetical protein
MVFSREEFARLECCPSAPARSGLGSATTPGWAALQGKSRPDAATARLALFLDCVHAEPEGVVPGHTERAQGRRKEDRNGDTARTFRPKTQALFHIWAQKIAPAITRMTGALVLVAGFEPARGFLPTGVPVRRVCQFRHTPQFYRSVKCWKGRLLT